jgi:hypothetical protein
MGNHKLTNENGLHIIVVTIEKTHLEDPTWRPSCFIVGGALQACHAIKYNTPFHLPRVEMPITEHFKRLEPFST